MSSITSEKKEYKVKNKMVSGKTRKKKLHKKLVKKERGVKA